VVAKNRRRFLRGTVCLGIGSLVGHSHERACASMTLLDLSRALAARQITSRQLVEQALAAIAAPGGEGARAFIEVHRDAALAAADRSDAGRKRGATLPALAGVPISIKDNFDEAGVTTRAGSTVLKKAPPAVRDATAVERLRVAGAIIIGRTNMTEFAYSGLGINPHYGTPRNAFDRAAARIPGGSSSGAAVTVSDGMAAAAIGTDTGGSVRIPAALNGLVGFKPTARRVPLDGVLPLSLTLDSAGPIARSVADCALLDRILCADATELPEIALRGLRLAVPQTVVLDDLVAPARRHFPRRSRGSRLRGRPSSIWHYRYSHAPRR
jgi:aspartyl-tRNA(Asn)/glutamyl-tRNA(Gln) amidotransferase subunit A